MATLKKVLQSLVLLALVPLVACSGGRGAPSDGEIAESSSSTQTCGQVGAPPQQQALNAGNTFCHDATLPPGASWVRPWMQAVADTPGSSVTVESLTLFGITSGGQTVPIAGTGVGQTTVTWFETDDRGTWFQNGVKHTGLTVPANMTFVIDSTALIDHWGNVGGDVTGFTDFFVQAEVTTTGDAKVQLGYDGYAPPGLGWESDGALSNWGACTNGRLRLSTPRRSAPMTCDAVAESSTPPANAGSGVCPGGVKVTAGPALLATCGNLEIVAWDNTGKQLTSAPHQALAFSQTWPGYAFVTTLCNGVWAPSWPKGLTAVQAGFSQVCVNGLDVTAGTLVCWDKFSNVYRPTVPLQPGEVGTCPP